MPSTRTEIQAPQLSMSSKLVALIAWHESRLEILTYQIRLRKAG
jgi:hypothetical protein